MTFVVSSDLWRRWWVCWRIEGIWSGPKMGCNTALANSLTPAYPQHTNMQTHKHTNMHTQIHNNKKLGCSMALVPVRHNLILNTQKYKDMPTQKHTYRQKKYVETKKYTNTKRFAAKRPWPPSWPQLTLNTSSFLHLRQNYFHKSFSPSSKLFHQILNFFTQVKTISTRAQKFFHQSSKIFSSRSNYCLNLA